MIKKIFVLGGLSCVLLSGAPQRSERSDKKYEVRVFRDEDTYEEFEVRRNGKVEDLLRQVRKEFGPLSSGSEVVLSFKGKRLSPTDSVNPILDAGKTLDERLVQLTIEKKGSAATRTKPERKNRRQRKN